MDVSGDAGIRVAAGSAEDAFASAAMGMFSLITDLDKVEEKESQAITYENDTLEGLLVGFLNELVFRFDAYGFIAKRVKIDGLGGDRIRATVYGETFDPGRHARGLLIKAATFHNLKVENTDGKWRMEVIFDI